MTAAVRRFIGIENDLIKVVAASSQGPNHLSEGKPCQDFYAVKVLDALVTAVVCDGAGSAAEAEAGAQATANIVAESLIEAAQHQNPAESVAPSAQAFWCATAVAVVEKARVKLQALAAAADKRLA